MINASIIVPVYNVRLYLNDCLESLVCQTCPSIEIILVDDGSTDGSAELCDKWKIKDKRIIVIHQKNGGLSDARNAGLAAATGEYVYFLDSDDYIEDDAIDVLLNVATRANADACFFDGITFTSESMKKANAPDFIRSYPYPLHMTGSQAMELFLKRGEYFPLAQMIFIRRQVLIQNQLQFYKGILHEDELFTYQLLDLVSCVACIPFQLFHHRIRPESIMTVKCNRHHFMGLATVFDFMMKDYMFGANRFSKDLCRQCLLHIFPNLISEYQKISLKDKIYVSKIKRRIYKQIKEQDYFNDSIVRWHVKNKTSVLLFNYAKETIKMLHMKPLFVRLKSIIPNESNRQPSDNDIISMLMTQNNPSGRILLMFTPEHGNLGDHMIAFAALQLLKSHFPSKDILEITTSVFKRNERKILNSIYRNDIIVITGGGWLGSLWPLEDNAFKKVIKHFPDNKIVVLPQTIYFNTGKAGQKEIQKTRTIYGKHKNLFICTRDRQSYLLFYSGSLGIDERHCAYIPDMVLSLGAYGIQQKREGIAFCMRADQERVLTNTEFRDLFQSLSKKYNKLPVFISTVVDHTITVEERENEINNMLCLLASKMLIVTDRLHCMLAAVITGTPCIAFNNVSQKVSGGLEWVQELPYIKLALTIDEARYYADELFEAPQNFSYNNVLCYEYDKIVRIIQEQVIPHSVQKGSAIHGVN